MAIPRQYLGIEPQRPNEVVAYAIDVSDIGGGGSVGTVVAKDITDPSNVTTVTGTVLSGSASISGTTITTRLVSNLTNNKKYRIIVPYTLSGNTLEYYFDLVCDSE